jgi:hypothetical protein
MTLAVPTYRIVTTLHRKSGIERDAVQNTWLYVAPSTNPSTTDFNNWIAQYQGFLHDIHTFLAASLNASTPQWTVEFFRLPIERPLPGTGVGPPVFVGTGSFVTPPGSIGYPSEVSVCLTLDGVESIDAEQGPGGTRPAARKRNRKYIGPLAGNVGVAESGTSETVVDPGVARAIVDAWKTAMQDGMITKGWAPNIWSFTNWAAYTILKVWVDNAFDTQRRRGQDPTLKTEEPTVSALPALNEIYRNYGFELAMDGGVLVRRQL